MENIARNVDIGKTESPKYDYFRVWNAKLFQWVPAEVEKKNTRVVEEIIGLCNESLPEILDLVANGYFEKEVSVREYLNHIRFPKLYFEIASPLGNIPVECRVRINPCLESQYKDFHHSKIWIIIANNNTNSISSEDLVKLYGTVDDVSEKISAVVSKCYLLPVAGSIERSYYNILARTSSIERSFLTPEMVNILFSRQKKFEKKAMVSQFEIIAQIIGDLLTELYDYKIEEPLPFFIENYEKLKWKLVNSRIMSSKLLYAIRAEDEASYISGVASIGDGLDKKDQLRKLFTPTALRLTSYM